MSRVLPFDRSPLRTEIEHLFKNEELSRAARKLLLPVNPAGEVERFAAATLIDEAIGQLVAARAALFPEAARVEASDPEVAS